MTLLEGLVALVIAGLAALGFLGAFEQNARATRDRTTWSDVVAYAESGMEAAKAGGVALADARGEHRVRMERRIERQPWQRGVDEIVVTVRASDGQAITLRRLAPAAP